MDLDFQTQIPSDFLDSSRLWIYQADRNFTTEEVTKITTILSDFMANWKSHGDDVKGFANVFFDRFIIVLADEAACGVSGCSTDSSVHLIKQLEKDFNISLFDRQQLAFWINGEIRSFNLQALNQAFTNGEISTSSLYFDNTIQTKAQLLERWIVPAGKSWLARRFPVVQYQEAR